MASGSLPEVKPVDGTTTVDEKVVFEPERLSYESAAALAGRLAELIRGDIEKKEVVIAGTRLLADLASLHGARVLLDTLQQEYDGMTLHVTDAVDRRMKTRAVTALTAALAPAAPAVAVVGTVASAVLGVMSLFRENVAYAGRVTAVDPLAFELSLADALTRGGASRVFVPELLTLKPSEDEWSLIGRLNRVERARAGVWAGLGPLVSHLVLLEGELAAAVDAGDAVRTTELTAEVSALRKEMEPLTIPLDRTDRRLSELQKEWSAVDPATGLTYVARLLRAESLTRLGAVYVHAAVVASGGHARTRSSLWRTVFSGEGLSFSGGVIVRWGVLESDGVVKRGGILTASRTKEESGA